MQDYLLTWVQLRAFGSKSSTFVICLRKSDSCIPGFAPLLLNMARGFDRITCRFTAKPAKGKRMYLYNNTVKCYFLVHLKVLKSTAGALLQ